ncbi:hypothetical protein D3C86_1715670 [compost metagenome]
MSSHSQKQPTTPMDSVQGSDSRVRTYAAPRAMFCSARALASPRGSTTASAPNTYSRELRLSSRKAGEVITET